MYVYFNPTESGQKHDLTKSKSLDFNKCTRDPSPDSVYHFHYFFMWLFISDDTICAETALMFLFYFKHNNIESSTKCVYMRLTPDSGRSHAVTNRFWHSCWLPSFQILLRWVPLKTKTISSKNEFRIIR